MKLVDHIASKLPIYILLGILGLLMIYYGAVFVPGNELELNNYAVRVLQNKAASIKEKYQAYGNAINSAPLSYFATWYFRFYPNEEVYVLEDSRTFHVSACEHCLPNPRHDTIRTITRETLNLARCDDNLRPSMYGPGTHGLSHDVWRVTSGDYYFVYSPSTDFYIHADSNFHAKTGNASRSAIKSVKADQYFWLRVRDFTENLKSNDFFDDLFIVREPNDTNNDTNASAEATGHSNEVLDESKLGIVRFPVPEIATQGGPDISTKIIAGNEYKVYCQPVFLKRGLNIYVVGLVATQKFNREAREVPPWFFVFCVLGSLILLLSLPILKLFFLNSFERLSGSDAKFSVFSVIASVSLVVTIMTGGLVFWGVERQSIDENLTTLSDRIDAKLDDELNYLCNILRDSNLFIGNGCELRNRIKTDRMTFNEVFSLTKNGNMKKVRLSDEKIRINPDSFPVRLVGRRYFQEAKRMIDSGHEKNSDFFIESINSLSTGKSEAAISIPYANKDGAIRVITSSLPSLVNAVMPSPYKFVVLNQQGSILFNYGNGERKFENFILECDNDEDLRAHIANNVSGHVDFNYLRNDCRGYVRPLLKDWHLVVYYELANSRNFAAQILSLCLITLVIVTLYSIVLHLVLRSHLKKPHLLGVRPFMFDWLNPNQHDAFVWRSLMWVNICLFIVELSWITVNRSVTLSLFFVFLMMTVTYFTNYKRLTSSSALVKNKPLGIMLVLICVWTLIIATKGLGTGNTKIAIAIPVFVAITLAASILHKPSLVSKSRAKNGRYFAYSLYLYSWLLVTALGPTIILFTDHFRFNNVIRVYSYALEDLRNVRVACAGQEMNVPFADYTNDATSPDPDLAQWPSDALDAYFYARAPRYIAHDPAIGGLQFNYVPAYQDYSILASPRHVKVTAKSETESLNPTSYRMASLSYNRHDFSINEFYFILAAIVALFLFWWAMRTIPRRIFYMPPHNYWLTQSDGTSQTITVNETTQPILTNRRTLVSDFSYEFQGDDRKEHPLYEFPKEDKKRLLTQYENAIRKAESEEHREFITEEFILKLQEAAKDKYENKWKACSDKVKFLLRDLAEDGVANQSDQVLIGTMARKGLVRLTPKLEVVNFSFANYVREAAAAEGQTAMDGSDGRPGRWKNMRTMLIIIIIAAIAFLSIAEQEFVGRASAVIASIGVLIPSLINIFGKVGQWLGGKPS